MFFSSEKTSERPPATAGPDEKHSSHRLDLDPGAAEVEASHNARHYSIDPAEERRVVRKLDMVIMPMMAVVYLFQCECSAS